MGKYGRYIICLMTVLFVLTACGGAGTDETGEPQDLTGQWQCEATASDGETDTSFYVLDVGDDGAFSMYDQAAGNPGISGQMENNTGTSVDCRFDTDEFDPPFCWEIDESGATLEYFLEGDALKLGHNGVWLTFHRIQEEEDL